MLGLLGGIISAVGAIQAGQSQKAEADYQAAVARNNKVIADQNAVYEVQAGQVEEQASRMKYGEVLGEEKAQQGASGIQTESGSAPKVRQTTQLMSELDAATIADNAAYRAYGLRTQGTNFESQARLYEFQGKQAETASFFNAAGSIIGGFSSMVGSGGMSGMSGMFGGSGAVAPKWDAFSSDNVVLPTPRPDYYGALPTPNPRRSTYDYSTFYK
jgi:hypothetical protein